MHLSRIKQSLKRGLERKKIEEPGEQKPYPDKLTEDFEPIKEALPWCIPPDNPEDESHDARHHHHG